ncbi:MAG: hypothetical protein UW76_C0031G0007 [Parcubacteria group bacterium GW2011_GWF2_44_8b]|nr:MAG: hypothetical protein UV94_C0009G0012 [Parcubacteria group bacterium GW2011_GWC1_43_30]KKT79251.1 MAG: hypothetical protein UW76_C0031G0007 [Parcubacteria group bacterium GW2011_GWF2_44_8b]KKT86192.1 MAG: hypothetical protein UW83_C0001G0003 [Parcubacteria group bacterium GW2011_GWD1_44_9]KKW33798.1 MAG: hypothetical protein UY80_C0031G0003 [Parcubacteria group bacterium GW2011_GWB1_53_43]
MSRNLHHANLLVGTPEEAESYLRSLCDSLDIKLANNPDFFAFRTETFGIDEARELRLLSTRKSITSRKIFLITPMRLTLEAQNALLKTFEDPSPDTLFFLAVREEGLVVSTLRSRMQAIRIHGNNASMSAEAEKFLSLSIKNRLLFAKSFADEEKNLSVFLDDLLCLLRKQSGMQKSLEKVYNIKRSIGDSITIPRLVLEHLSLVL